MNLIIYILGQPKEEEALNIEGVSGTTYQFSWIDRKGRYEYRPRTKDEAEDLFSSQGIHSMFFFAGEISGEAGPAGPVAKAIPPPALERKYYGDFDNDELAAALKDAGVKVPAGSREDRETLFALMDAYWLGRGYKLMHGRENGPFVPFVPAAPVPVTETAATGVTGPTVTAETVADDMPDAVEAEPVVHEQFRPDKLPKPKRAAKPPGMAKAAQLANA